MNKTNINLNTNTIIILREDLDHIIKKPDVWIVYTTKSSRPWVCIPNGIEYSDSTNSDATITLTLAIK